MNGIEVKDISVTYKNGYTALSETSFSLPKSTITALVGVNGSGTVSYTHLTLPTKRIV